MSLAAADAPLRVLVIGCGRIAGGFDAARDPRAPPLTHAGAYQVHPGFAMVACVDPDDGARAAFARHWRVPRQARDLGTLEAVPGEFDVISICSPTACHASDIDAALRLRPRAIFCEKPVTSQARETRRLVDACRAAGVLLMVNHTRRWAPDVLRFRDTLAAGQWGAIRSISGLYNKGVLNNGSHLVDLVQLLAGPLQVVAAGPATNDHSLDDPSVSALLRTHSGVPVALATAHAADYAVFELQVVAEAGVVAMENGGLRWRTRRAGPSPDFQGYQVLEPAQESAGEYLHAMTHAVRNLHDALLRGAPAASSGDTALLAQEVCEGILAASQATFKT